MNIMAKCPNCNEEFHMPEMEWMRTFKPGTDISVDVVTCSCPKCYTCVGVSIMNA